MIVNRQLIMNRLAYNSIVTDIRQNMTNIRQSGMDLISCILSILNVRTRGESLQIMGVAAMQYLMEVLDIRHK